MIREWQRNQAPAGQPTIDQAEDDGILKIGPAWTRCEGDWLIAIAVMNRFDPGARMEDRGMRVMLYKLKPAGIGQRVEGVHLQRALQG